MERQRGSRLERGMRLRGISNPGVRLRMGVGCYSRRSDLSPALSASGEGAEVLK